MTYSIIDTQTKAIVKTFTEAKKARVAAHKMDEKYGSHKYTVVMSK